MKLSVSRGLSDFRPMVINGNNALEHVIKKYNYSFGIFKNNHRSKENFIEAYALVSRKC